MHVIDDLVLYTNTHGILPGAQQYRDLMMILQSHRMLSVFTWCFPNALYNVLLIYPRSCLPCFSAIPLFLSFNSQNFLFTCLCSFFTCLAVYDKNYLLFISGALLRQKNAHLLHAHVNVHVGARSAQAQNAQQLHKNAYAHYVARRLLQDPSQALKVSSPVTSSHGSKD